MPLAMGNGHRLASFALGDTPGRPSASYELVASSTGGKCDDKHDGRHLIRVLPLLMSATQLMSWLTMRMRMAGHEWSCLWNAERMHDKSAPHWPVDAFK